MKINYFLIILAFLASTLQLTSQVTIEGKVLDEKNEPLEGAAVYLNNTSIGTTTNELGEFELRIKEGSHDLIVSFFSFETIQYSLNTDNYSSPLTFKLIQKNNVLDEVVISNKKKKMSAEDRAYFMGRFKRNFLGKTNLAKECIILNEEVIEFYFDKTTNTLTADTKEPLKIKNRGLGYLITYDLVHFELDQQRISYLGYTRFEKLKGSKRKDRKWDERRRTAYNGSTMHFFRSVVNNNLKEEGYVIDQFKEVPNPKRPSDSLINDARKRLRYFSKNDLTSNFKLFSTKDLNIKANRDEVIDRMANNPDLNISLLKAQRLKGSAFDVIKNSDGTYTAKTKVVSNKKRDSLMSVIQKSRLKKYVNVPLKNDLTRDDFAYKEKDNFHLRFDHQLKIKYMNEPEEDNYRFGNAKLDHQISMIFLYVKNTPIDNSGVLVRPLDIFLNGYWSYEKLADALPLDYTPD